jgi:HD superfamily phosphodiesterase
MPALPHMGNVRCVHIPLSYAFARELLKHHPDADEDIVSLAIILHDIGWYTIDMRDIIEKGFGPNMMQSDVRFLHEREGVRMSREVLEKANWPEAVIAAVGEIIDGHDTRPQARSLNDRLVRDADKLWRFTVTGVAVACDWFKMTPRQYADRLEQQVSSLETEVGPQLAARALAETRRALMLHLI